MKKILISLLILLFSVLNISHPSFVKAQLPTATVFLDPAQQTIPIGTTYGAQIKISNAQNLGGFELTLRFDPSIVKLTSSNPQHVLGAFLGSTGNSTFQSPTLFNNDTGYVTVAFGAFGTNPGPSGNGTLITLYFDTVGTGTSNITLEDVILSTSDFDPLLQPSTVNNGSVTVTGLTPSPSPSASASPISSPSPSASPSITPSVSPGTGLETLNMSIVFQNVDAAANQPQPVDVNISFRQSGVEKLGITQQFTPDTSNIYISSPIQISSLDTGNYDICVDAAGHLTKCFRNVTLSDTVTNLEFTNVPNDMVLGGDAHVTTPEIVDIFDYAIFRNDYKGSNIVSVSTADFDFDNDVDIYDFTFFVINFDKTGDL